MVEKRIFGRTKSGEVVYAFTVKDGERSAVILTYGGAVQSLVVPDRDGNPVDVLLGYDTLKEYEEGGAFFGALIGRVGNRLGGAKFSVDGTEYRVSRNEPFNSLHGGFRGFDKVVWQGEEIENGVKLSYLSKDGEEGYPGNLKVEVKYTFLNGEFSVDYHAVSDKTTAIAMTWHGYFNLNGAGRESGADNFLQIEADKIIPSDENLLPTGEFRNVKGTPFDFNEAKRMGRDLFADDIDLRHGKGYDHCFLLKNDKRYEKCAEAYSERTGICLECFTDLPALQLYSANYVDEKGKGGYYAPNCAYALEAQAITNNLNVPAYAKISSSLYRAGEEYRYKTTYRFGVKQ